MPKKQEKTEEVTEQNPSDNVKEIFAEFSAMPEPTKTIENELESEPEIIAESGAKSHIDSSGQAFDPAIHLMDKAGNPTLRADGTFRKKPGRKVTQTSGSVSQPVNPQQQGNVNAKADFSAPIIDPAQAKRAAEGSADLLFMAGMMIDADEFAPIKDKESGFDERKLTEFAFENYYMKKGITDIPPGMTLALVIGSYGARRLQMPRTGGKCKQIFNWLMGKK
ncbi:MAG: hypothetical protein ACYC5U_12555 [Rhodocyclaceae bacterium]